MNVLPYYPIEEHRCRFLYVVGSGVKPGVEGKRRPGREIEPMSSPENRRLSCLSEYFSKGLSRMLVGDSDSRASAKRG